jgi:hypothetical protein
MKRKERYEKKTGMKKEVKDEKRREGRREKRGMNGKERLKRREG